MGYLMIARHEGERVVLRAQPGTDARELLNDLLFDGIAIDIVETAGNGTWLGITLPDGLVLTGSE